MYILTSDDHDLYTDCLNSHPNEPPPSVTVRSIETKRMGVQEVHAGQSATFAVRVLGRRPALRRGTFRKGMVCIAEGDPPQVIR